MDLKIEGARLAFGESAGFLSDSLGLKGAVVMAFYDDGRCGINTAGLNGVEVQNALCVGIYLNAADAVKRNGGVA